MAGKNKYYAYLLPSGEKGVVSNWPDCDRKVKGVQDARYRGFKTESEARSWLNAGAVYEIKEKEPKPKLLPGIYFDAGTGRGKGVEVSVTDEKGKDLLSMVLPKPTLNKFGKHLIRSKSATNNYGELLAMKYALMIAEKTGAKKVFGDSKLVLNFWSKGFIKEEVSKRTKELAKEVLIARLEFEAADGEIDFISGDWNPADLGFH